MLPLVLQGLYIVNAEQLDISNSSALSDNVQPENPQLQNGSCLWYKKKLEAIV